MKFSRSLLIHSLSCLFITWNSVFFFRIWESFTTHCCLDPSSRFELLFNIPHEARLGKILSYWSIKVISLLVPVFFVTFISYWTWRHHSMDKSHAIPSHLNVLRFLSVYSWWLKANFVSVYVLSFCINILYHTFIW